MTVKMGDTVKEVLKSNNTEIVKRSRAIFKGKLIRAANALVEVLKKNEKGDFLFDQIIDLEVTALLSNLHKMKELVDDLHIKYTVTRVCKDGSSEHQFEEEDEQYAIILEKAHWDALKVYFAYSSQLQAQENICKNREALEMKCVHYQEKLMCFKAKIIEYDSAFNEAMTVVMSEDEFIHRTASLQKALLCKEYDSLLSMGQELLVLAPLIEAVDESDKKLFNCSKVKLNHRKALTSLERLIQKIEVEDKIKLAKFSPSPLT